MVVFTSSREEQDVLWSYRLGNNAFVVKPVDFDAFVEGMKTIGAFWTRRNEPPPDLAWHVHSDRRGDRATALSRRSGRRRCHGAIL